MAKAKKCDRCGKYYDKNEGIKSINGYFVRTIRLETSGPYMNLDLCDPCIYDLYKFLGLDEEDQNE